MEIQLKHPFTTAAGQHIKVVQMRRPKVKDLKAASAVSSKEADQEVALLARLTGLTVEDMEEMDLTDYGRLQTTFRAMVGSAGESVANAGPAGAVVPVSAQ